MIDIALKPSQSIELICHTLKLITVLSEATQAATIVNYG